MDNQLNYSVASYHFFQPRIKLLITSFSLASRLLFELIREVYWFQLKNHTGLKAAGVCQTAESTINKSLIEELLGTFLLVRHISIYSIFSAGIFIRFNFFTQFLKGLELYLFLIPFFIRFGIYFIKSIQLFIYVYLFYNIWSKWYMSRPCKIYNI